MLLPRPAERGTSLAVQRQPDAGLIHLKSEWVHHHLYHTRDEAKTDVSYYIESFYNRRRRHSALDYLSPEAYEQTFHQGVLALA
jgi:transposase InsO family protein